MSMRAPAAHMPTPDERSPITSAPRSADDGCEGTHRAGASRVQHALRQQVAPQAPSDTGGTDDQQGHGRRPRWPRCSSTDSSARRPPQRACDAAREVMQQVPGSQPITKEMHGNGRAYSKKPLHVSAKEFTRATEIELNELLKRFVVRQAKRRDGQRPRAEPACQSLRSWRPVERPALRLAGMPDYLLFFF